jgi:hypothetical protein
MAVNTQGTAHLFGIQGGVGVITNATVLSFNEKKSHANVAETLNEIGNKIELRQDDEIKEATLVLRPRSGFTPLTVGGLYTYENEDYVVIDETIDEQQAGFLTYTYTLRAHEYIAEA